MWPRFKAFTKDVVDIKAVHRARSLNVNEEYLSVFRTQSFADFLSKAQLLAPKSSSSSSSLCLANISDVLLEPAQETITGILETAMFSKKTELRNLIGKYFDVSADASRVCSCLLTSIDQVQSNYKFIQRALDVIEDYSPERFKLAMSALNSFNLLKNPFSLSNHSDFKHIHDHYASVLQHLKSKRKKIARKIKLIKCFKQASGVGLTAACGVAVALAILLAAHTVFGLFMSPAIFSMSSVSLNSKKLMNFRIFRSGFLKKLGLQLDVAAKGAYILSRDFDTMSRLVTRLHDEIEHKKGMIRFCLERQEDKYPLQEVVKELRKSDLGFTKQVEELEEHVYLCLVTINKARVLVMKEMTENHVAEHS